MILVYRLAMIGDQVSRMLNVSPTIRRIKRIALASFVVIILLATNPSLDEFKAYAMLNSENPGNVVAARTSYWFLFSIYQLSHHDKSTQTWGNKKTYIGVLHNFIFVGENAN